MQQSDLILLTETAAAASGGATAISIIIPTYNRTETVIDCLRHLESQTCRDFDVLVVDDGSTSGTREAVERYRASATFPIRYLYQENRGPGHARNNAMACVNAPVCIMIGDDILASPDFVRLHLEYHRTHVDLETVAVGYTVWDRKGQVVTPYMDWLEVDGRVQFAYPQLLRGATPDWKHFYTSNLSFKTAYLRANPFHEDFKAYGMEDIELGYRLSKKHGLKMSFLPEAIAYHRHPTTFLQTCQRMVAAGASGYIFSKLWPELSSTPSRGVRQMLSRVFTDARVVLPALRRLTDVLNGIWCPNPLLYRVLILHSKLGYKQAAADERKSIPS